MSLLNVPAGKDLPEDIYVVIEIPANADPIKYEVDKESGALFVDRFMSTAMFYPCNYGYINHTLSLDGDPVDVLVPTPYPLQPGSVIRCRPVGVLKMTDESGEDAKLVAVPHTKLSKEYDHINDVNDLPELPLRWQTLRPRSKPAPILSRSRITTTMDSRKRFYSCLRCKKYHE